MANYDFIILGAGPGGYTAAIRAAQREAKVALIERERLGGACLNWGCIPTKALYKTSLLYQTMTHAENYGLECAGLKADLARMVARKNRIVDQLRQGVAQLLKRRRVDYLTGRGRLAGPDRVVVETEDGQSRELRARFIILATGSESAGHPVVPTDGQTVYDIRSLLETTDIPDSFLIIGGGVAGLEFAQVFSALGVEVTINEMLTSLMPGLDADIEKTLVRTLKKRKYRLVLGDTIEQAEVGPNRFEASLASGGRIEAERVLVAVGSRPLTRDIGLEALGVETTERGFIEVDEHCRTNLETIYAIGDVTGLMPLAHFASHMGLTAVAHALGDKTAEIDKDHVPKTIFTDPELAWVGLSEAEAKERHGRVKVGTFLFRALGRTLADGNLDGLVKIVAAGDDDRVVGVHIIGPEASTLIAEGTLAVRRGLSLHDLTRTIHAHPTYPEAIYEAAEDALGLAIHKL